MGLEGGTIPAAACREGIWLQENNMKENKGVSYDFLFLRERVFLPQGRESHSNPLCGCCLWGPRRGADP